MKRSVGFILLMAFLVACSTGPAPETNLTDEQLDNLSDGELQSLYGFNDREYELSIENLTTGQPMSPAVIATHYRYKVLFNRGSKASEGIRAIAENGDPSVAEQALTGQRGIAQVFTTDAPVHRIGGPGDNVLTTRFTAERGAWRLSLATMLICTNDGFTGLDAAWLPYGFYERSYYLYAYDAGTEKNDELASSIVPPCFAIGPVQEEGAGGLERTATDDVIRFHPGIKGNGDLDPALHGWRKPVAKVTVKRVRPEPVERNYKVSIENLTSGQPLSPGIFVTHSPQVRLFRRGFAASEGIRAIAESGDPSVALAALTGVSGVQDVVASDAPAFIDGDPVSVTLKASSRNSRLSLASMLICTNDGFTGLNSVRLPSFKKSVTYYAYTYDAGTEKNDELAENIVPPCFAIGPVQEEGAGGGGRVATDGVVSFHPGIKGGADLDASLHGWRGPTAKITIERME